MKADVEMYKSHLSEREDEIEEMVEQLLSQAQELEQARQAREKYSQTYKE